MIATNPGKHWRQPRVKQLEAFGEEMSGPGPAGFLKKFATEQFEVGGADAG
jgi:hypothetical protein